MSKDGWGVVADDGLDMRTIGPTRRSAIVNWLVAECSIMVYANYGDERIEALWEVARGKAEVHPVRCTVIVP